MGLNEAMLVSPDWEVPNNIRAFTTTVLGGVSQGKFKGLNLGEHVRDDASNVAENRQILQKYIGTDTQLCWLHQTHSDIVLGLEDYQGLVEADASVSHQVNKASIVMTADCLPVLLCSQSGSHVAALHCGWKGLYKNIISKTIQQHFPNEPVIAWLGPAIGQQSYEVDEMLYQRFLAANSNYHRAFFSNRAGHYLFDLYEIARQQLVACEVVTNIYGGDFDTYTDSRFYSYRQQAETGRIATVIYRV